jgi:hypothetical protein
VEFLRQNTATIVAVGPFLDRLDGVTPKTALAITNERITLIAATDAGSAPTIILDNVTGATAATSNDLNYITGQDNGMMQMELSAVDINRVGRMRLTITDASNHCPVVHDYFVLPTTIYDWFTGVTANLSVNTVQIGSQTASAAATVTFPATVASTTNITTVGAVSGAVGSVTGNVGGNVTGSVGSVVSRVTANADQLAGQTVTAAAGVTFPASVASPTNITAGTITTTTNLTNAPTVGDLTATMKASVTTAASASTPSVTVSDKTGFSLSSAGIQAIWDALTSVLTTVGSIGKKLVDSVTQTGDSFARIGATGSGLTSLSSQTSVNSVQTTSNDIYTKVDTEVAAIKAVTDKIDTAVELDGSAYRFTTNALALAPTGSGGGGLDAAGVRAAIGLASANLDTQLADIPTVAEFNARTIVSADYATATALATVDSVVNSILVDTAEIGTAGAGLTALASQSSLNTVAGYIDTEVAAIKAVTDAIPDAGALTTIQADLDNIQTRIPAALSTGRMVAYVEAMATDVVDSNALASTAITEIQSGLATSSALTTAQNDLDILTGSNGVTLATSQPNYAPYTGTPPTAAAIADQVWDEVLSGHLTAGTTGEKLSSASGVTASDIRSAIGLASANLDTQLSTIDGVVASILVDTAEIGVAGVGLTDINLPNQTMDIIGNITGSVSGSVGSVTNRVTSNVDQIAGSTTAATNLSKSALGVVYGTAVTGTLSNTQMKTDLTETTNDHYVGRIIVWTSGSLTNQASDVTAYDGPTKVLTYTATTDAPSNGDTWVMV